MNIDGVYEYLIGFPSLSWITKGQGDISVRPSGASACRQFTPYFFPTRLPPALLGAHARTPSQKFIRGIRYFWWVLRAGINHTRGPLGSVLPVPRASFPVHARSIRFISIRKKGMTAGNDVEQEEEEQWKRRREGGERRRGSDRERTRKEERRKGREIWKRNRIAESVYRRGRNRERRLNAQTWSELKPFVDIGQISLRTRATPSWIQRWILDRFIYNQKHRGDLRSFSAIRSAQSYRHSWSFERGSASVLPVPLLPLPPLHVDWN